MPPVWKPGIPVQELALLADLMREPVLPVPEPGLASVDELGLASVEEPGLA